MRHYRNQMMRPARTRSLALDVMKGAAINEIGRRQRAAAEQPQANRMMEALRSAGGNLNVPGATSPREVQNLYQMQTNVEKSQQAEKDRATEIAKTIGDTGPLEKLAPVPPEIQRIADTKVRQQRVEYIKSGNQLGILAMDSAPASKRTKDLLGLQGMNPATGQEYTMGETAPLLKRRQELLKIETQRKKLSEVSAGKNKLTTWKKGINPETKQPGFWRTDGSGNITWAGTTPIPKADKSGKRQESAQAFLKLSDQMSKIGNISTIGAVPKFKKFAQRGVYAFRDALKQTGNPLVAKMVETSAKRVSKFDPNLESIRSLAEMMKWEYLRFTKGTKVTAQDVKRADKIFAPTSLLESTETYQARIKPYIDQAKLVAGESPATSQTKMLQYNPETETVE